VSLGAAGSARSGLILLRKPEGETSFRAIGPVKRRLGITRIGHAGTLDKFARGLLVALSGSYSRLAGYVQAGKKVYRGIVRFGTETDTLDPEGRVVAEAPAPSRERLDAVLPGFTGTIMQAPPAFSAIHIEGKRAYELALSGSSPDMKKRPVTIASLEILSYDGTDALMEIRCSSGTYVRSLARDIALACGSRAHLAALESLRIGPFSLEDAVAPEEFDPESDVGKLSRNDAKALGLGTASLPKKLTIRFLNGSRIGEGELFDMRLGSANEGIAVFGEGEGFLGIVSTGSGILRSRMVLPSGEELR